MRIAILDDYQQCVRALSSYKLIEGRDVTVFHDSLSDEDELAARLKDFEVVVPIRERTHLTARLIDRLACLRLVAAAGPFPACIDLAACSARGIGAAQGRSIGAPTAELCWAMVLASRRHLVQEVQSLRAGHWQSHLGVQVRGQTLGIWGYGRVGQQVAEYGRVFGMEVKVWGSERAREQARAHGLAAFGSREELFRDSDVVSLHLRLVPQTTGIVSETDLRAMKPDALLVNTSRAELIAPGALLTALDEGRPGFAAIDVFEHEPVMDARHPLLQRPNVLATPHIGFVERQNYEGFYQGAFEQILRFEAGDYSGLLNPEALAPAAAAHRSTARQPTGPGN